MKQIGDYLKQSMEIINANIKCVEEAKKQLIYINELTKSISKFWSESYAKILSESKKIFGDLDFENIDNNIKNRCIFLVENGFYTYGRMSCFFETNIGRCVKWLN